MVDKLVEECTNVIDGDRIYNETLNEIPSDDCASCTIYAVLFTVFLSTSVIISGAFEKKNAQLSTVRVKLNHVLKQQFIEHNFIKYNSAEHRNGNKTTKYQKQDILFLE